MTRGATASYAWGGRKCTPVPGYSATSFVASRQEKALYNQHWEQGLRRHSVGDTAKHQAFESCRTTRSQDNGITGPAYGCLTNDISDIPIGQMCFVGNASSRRASLSQGECVLGARCGTVEEGTDAARVNTQQAHGQALCASESGSSIERNLAPPTPAIPAASTFIR